MPASLAEADAQGLPRHLIDPSAASRSTAAAVHDSALRSSSARSLGTLASCDGKPRVDASWLAFEDRITSHVSSLQQKQAEEQQDSERVLRASVTRLDSRLRALESQSVRADRRAAELAGLAQALTEEQRELLGRLDHLEEQFRGGGPGRSSGAARRGEIAAGAGSEEWLRRLGRLEHEQRQVAMNLRMMAGLTEEAQQRHSQRMRNLEELIEGRLRSAEERSEFSPSPVPARDARRPLGAELSAAEHRATQSLEVAQDLLRRCDGASDHCNVEGASALAGGQPSAEADSPPPREARSATVEELRRQIERLASSGRAGLGGPDHSAHLLKAHSAAIHDLHARFGEAIGDLAPRTDAVEARLQALVDTVEELRERDVGGRDVPQHQLSPEHEQATAADRLRINEVADNVKSHESFLTSCHETQRALGQSLSDLQGSIDQVAQSLAATEDDFSNRLRLNSEAIDEVRAAIKESSAAQPSASCDLRSMVREAVEKYGGGIPVSSEEVDGWHSHGLRKSRAELAEDLVNLKERHETLQEVIDQQVVVSVWNVERQLPEMMEKVERVLEEHSERSSKSEENEVRLTLALTKISAHEHKVQSLMERIERVPSTNQVKMSIREELRKHLEDSNIEGVALKVDLQARAVEELGERLQHISDQIIYSSMPMSPSSSFRRKPEMR